MDRPTLASALMGVEDDPITSRGTFLPFVERKSGKAEIGLPSFLNDPWTALQRLSAGGYQPGTRDEQGVKDSATLAGALMMGGLGLNWAGQVPKGVLGSAGGQAPTKGITAYHGSPHDFDKFDTTKIGTGEGAQAYGHGLYFAEAEGVAKQYRDVLSTPTKPEGMPDVVFGGLRSGDFSKLAEMPPAARKTFAAKEMADAEAELKAASSSQSGIDMMRVPELRRRVEAYKWLAENPETSLSPPGRLYEVRINADPESFLDWDKPIGQQPKAVQDYFESADIPMREPWKESGAWPHIKGETLYKEISGGGTRGAHAKGMHTDASATLRDAGIPGIKYLDQGSRAPKTLFDGKPIAKGGTPEALAAEKIDLYDTADAALASLEKDIARGGYGSQMARDAAELLRSGRVAKHQPEGTRNYVVFDADKIEILKKYGWVPAGVVGGGMMMTPPDGQEGF
jgi:hypothetical protein